MEAICYVCNEKTSAWHRNLVETKSIHSNTPIIVFIDKFLDNYVSHRNMNDESNCICSECLSRIYSYDWMCMKVEEQENELRTLIRKTEDSFINNHIKSEFEFVNAAELEKEDCTDNQLYTLNTEDSFDGTEEIEINQTTFIKNETPDNSENDEEDEVEDDIHKAKSVDTPVYLMVTESPTRNRPNRQRKRPKRYSNEDGSRSQAGSSSQRQAGLRSVRTFSKRSNQTKKRPDQNETSNSTDNHQSKQQATQGQKKFKCHRCGSSYSNKKALNKHERLKHAEMLSKYVCPLCDVECSMPYTLRDHLKDVHRKIVTLEYAKDRKKLYRNTNKAFDLTNQKPKRKFKKFTCKCNVVISGISNFNRHVKHMHGLNNWMDQIKSKEETIPVMPFHE